MQARKQVKSPGADGTSKTQQHHAPMAETSSIVNRHLSAAQGQTLANIGNPRASRQPMFIDVPSESFHESLNRVTQVKLMFSSLPARLRGMFSNDPYQMLLFIENPANRPRALKLGLVEPTDEEAQALAVEAAKAQRVAQVDLIREAMALKADPEAQPSYKPPEGAKGGQAPKGA